MSTSDLKGYVWHIKDHPLGDEFRLLKEILSPEEGVWCSCVDYHGNKISLLKGEIVTFVDYLRSKDMLALASVVPCPQGMSVAEYSAVVDLVVSEQRAALAAAAPNTEPQDLKADMGKARYDLIPPMALEAVAYACAYGVTKYPDPERPWQTTIDRGVRYGRLFAAVMRHMWAWWRGEENDAESGMPHLACAAWNAMWLLEYCMASRLTGKGQDDRPSPRNARG